MVVHTRHGVDLPTRPSVSELDDACKWRRPVAVTMKEQYRQLVPDLRGIPREVVPVDRFPERRRRRPPGVLHEILHDLAGEIMDQQRQDSTQDAPGHHASDGRERHVRHEPAVH